VHDVLRSRASSCGVEKWWLLRKLLALKQDCVEVKFLVTMIVIGCDEQLTEMGRPAGVNRCTSNYAQQYPIQWAIDENGIAGHDIHPWDR
jgi:hypothetical protein